MNELWSVSIMFRASSNAKQIFGETSASVEGANKKLWSHQAELDKTGAAVDRLKSKYSGLADGFKASINGLAIAAAATVAIGIKTASDLQDAYSRIGVQSGKSGPAIDRMFSKTMLSASNRTGISLTDILGMGTELSGVLKDPGEVNAALDGGGKGGIVDLVNVLKRSGASTGAPEEIAKSVVTIDHILNAYTGDAMRHVNDKLYRAVVGSHMKLSTLETQIGYFGEQFRLASGGRPAAVDDILKLSELGYWGIGKGKWGAGFGQILRSVDHPTKMSMPALKTLGILDANGKISDTTQNSKGEFTPWKMIEEARKRSAGMTPMQQQELINKLPANAARVFAEALSPKTTAFLARQEAAQGNMLPLLQTQAEFMGNLNEQTQRLTENFKNFAAQLAAPWITTLTKPFKALADFFGNAAMWMHAHPSQAKLAGAGVGALGAYGAYQIAKMTGNFVGVGLEIAKHGPRARIFGGHHSFGGAGHAVERESGPIGNAVSGIGRAIVDTMLMRSTRGELGGVRSGLGAIFKGIPGMSKLFRGFEALSGVMDQVGARLLIGRIGLGMIGGIIARIGLRAIPVVGEVLMLIDTIKFLGSHSKDIGKGLAIAAHWIMTTGKTLLLDAASAVWRAMIDGFKSIFNFGKGGLIDWVKNSAQNGIKGFQDEQARLAAEDKRAQAHHAPAGNHSKSKTEIHNVSINVDGSKDAHHTAKTIGYLLNNLGNPNTKYGMNPSSSFAHPGIAAA
jgi:hypothetical protein